MRETQRDATTRESIKALVHELAVSETLYIRANKRNEDGARQRFREAAKAFEEAVDSLLSENARLQEELNAIDATLGNASGFDDCATRVEKVALMLRTLRVRNVKPLSRTPSQEEQ